MIPIHQRLGDSQGTVARPELMPGGNRPVPPQGREAKIVSLDINFGVSRSKGGLGADKRVDKTLGIPGYFTITGVIGTEFSGQRHPPFADILAPREPAFTATEIT